MVDTNSHVGETNMSSDGTKMKIIAYRKADDIDVEFLDKHYYIKQHTSYQLFKQGVIRNPYGKNNYGIGCTGDGKYLTAKDSDGKHPQAYTLWKGLLNRCYNEKEAKNFPEYYGIATVCDEWLNYQNFAEWFYKNRYEIGDERLHLDKDIKYYGNKIYSPYHCYLVPQSINEQFRVDTRRKTKDIDLPYTVRRTKNGMYESYHRGKSLGKFDTVDECIKAYITSKKNYIAKLVEKYEYMPEEIKQAILKARLK